MVMKRANLGKSIEGQAAGKQHHDLKDAGKLLNSANLRQVAIKSLLEPASTSVDDKVATLKTAHHLDKDRFQSAFRSLLGTPKS